MTTLLVTRARRVVCGKNRGSSYHFRNHALLFQPASPQNNGSYQGMRWGRLCTMVRVGVLWATVRFADATMVLCHIYPQKLHVHLRTESDLGSLDKTARSPFLDEARRQQNFSYLNWRLLLGFGDCWLGRNPEINVKSISQFSRFYRFSSLFTCSDATHVISSLKFDTLHLTCRRKGWPRWYRQN